jgi:hypothetical protein
LLGALAVTNATVDYFFTQGTDTFKLTGLTRRLVYNLEFFGTRATNQTRTTTYTVGGNSVSLTTSGTGIGAGGVNQNNNTTAVLRALSPTPRAKFRSRSRAAGGFAYIGILKIEQVYLPPSTNRRHPSPSARPA